MNLPLQFLIRFSAKIIRPNCEKCWNPPQHVENHCSSGGVRAIGLCYGCGSISIVWFSRIRWTFRYARSQMSAVPPSASVPRLSKTALYFAQFHNRFMAFLNLPLQFPIHFFIKDNQGKFCPHYNGGKCLTQALASIFFATLENRLWQKNEPGESP